MHIHCLIMLNVKLILSIIRISIINIIRDVHISNMYKKTTKYIVSCWRRWENTLNQIVCEGIWSILLYESASCCFILIMNKHTNTWRAKEIIFWDVSIKSTRDLKILNMKFKNSKKHWRYSHVLMSF